MPQKQRIKVVAFLCESWESAEVQEILEANEQLSGLDYIKIGKMYYYEDLEIKDIAEALNYSPTAIRSKIHDIEIMFNTYLTVKARK